MWEADNELGKILVRRLMAVVTEMETSSQVKGFISEEGEMGRKEVWIVRFTGKFLGGEYWKLLASHLKDSI